MASTWTVKQLFSRLWTERPSRGQGPRVVTTDTLEIGHFRIDLAARWASVRGRELQLSAAEFDLLVFLANHPNKIVTPRTLLSTDWGGHAVRQVQFLEVLLSLRRKLNTEGTGQHYLRTEPWIFYRFDPGGA